MAGQRFLICPRRPGRPKMAVEVCRACGKNHLCPAWREYLVPPLFPGLRPDPPTRD